MFLKILFTSLAFIQSISMLQAAEPTDIRSSIIPTVSTDAAGTSRISISDSLDDKDMNLLDSVFLFITDSIF